ncbi:MAG: histidine kinase dimerization/phospho-acceptor domain-containing protein, partial [Gemmatimonadaceae bacterium]
MTSTATEPAHQEPLAFLAGGGEMGERIRAFDWSSTSLGAPESWPQSLRSAVSILLPSRAQIIVFWGPDLITIYNDAYQPVFGAKHPHVLGLPAREAWKEIWDVGLKELFEGVVNTGVTYWASDRLFFLERYGYPEETFFDVSYDPVRDETGRVGGVFCIVNDTTARVVGARRLRTLTEFGARIAEAARSPAEACVIAEAILGTNRFDVPFSLFYLLDAEGRKARLCSACDFGGDAVPAQEIDLFAPNEHSSPWPLCEVMTTGHAQIVTRVEERLGLLPGNPWPEPTDTAVVLPIRQSAQHRVAGFLVAGVSPRLPLDKEYLAFLDLVTAQVSTAITSARSFEEEKRRAEALAELDRAKTAFFSNVSHEFRTPLTLMLGPVEEMLNQDGADLTPSAREQLAIVSRNGLRLLRLVNTLLDFSRIEAGRVRAAFRPID